MGVSSVWFLHGVKFPGAQFLSQLDDAQASPKINELVAYAAGYPDPLFLAEEGSVVEQTFTTTQIKTILDLCGAGGIADLSAGNTDLFYKLGTNLGVRAADASTVHQRMRMTTGAMYWNDISVEHQKTARLGGRIVPIFNGTNSPLIPAGGLALSGTPTSAELYTLGPLEINGSELPGVGRMRIGLELKLMELGAGGDLYTTFCAVELRAQYIEAESLEVGAWNTFGLDGLAVSSVVGYLRRKTADGGNVANGTASHISVTGSAGRCAIQNTRGGGNKPASTTLRISLRTTAAGTAVFAINTATAIA